MLVPTDAEGGRQGAVPTGAENGGQIARATNEERGRTSAGPTGKEETEMFIEAIREALALIGLLTVMVALLGIGLNEILYGTWYGETEAQRRERMRKERRKATGYRRTGGQIARATGRGTREIER